MRTSSIAVALLGAAAFASDGRAQAPAPAQPPAAQAAPAEAKPTSGKVGELIPAATAKVTRGGKETTLDTQKNGKTTVYYLIGLTCPATKPYLERVQALEATYMAKGIDFVYVYVNKPETAADKAKFHKEAKFQGAFWNDADCAFVKSLKAQKTGGYDRVLMDVKMPGVDGIAAYKSLSRLFPKLPVVLMTAHRVADVEHTSARVVTKPLDLPALFSMLETQV